MCKEADRSAALGTILAKLGPVLGRMQPALVHPMGVCACITLCAHSKIWLHDTS